MKYLLSLSALFLVSSCAIITPTKSLEYKRNVDNLSRKQISFINFSYSNEFKGCLALSKEDTSDIKKYVNNTYPLIKDITEFKPMYVLKYEETPIDKYKKIFFIKDALSVCSEYIQDQSQYINFQQYNNTINNIQLKYYEHPILQKRINYINEIENNFNLIKTKIPENINKINKRISNIKKGTYLVTQEAKIKLKLETKPLLKKYNKKDVETFHSFYERFLSGYTSVMPSKDIIYILNSGKRIVQKTDEGYLISIYHNGINMVLIKTNKEYIDGSYISGKYYTYDGTYSYMTVKGGQSTIFSFKEVE